MAVVNVELRDALVEEGRRERARRDLRSYCNLIDPSYDTESPHIRFLIDLLRRIEQGTPEKAIITLMPRSGKSALLCKFAAFWLGRNTNKSLLLLSASQNLAVRNSRWIRNQIVESGRYPWDVSVDESSSSILSWRTSTGNEVRAFSVGSTITGQGGHLILCDDIQPDLMSTLTRDSLETWLRSVLEGRREPEAPVVVLQNRWSSDDLVARLHDGADGDSYEVINLPALAGDDDILGREPGESIWPSKWPVPLLEKKRLAVGEITWEASWQCRPVPSGGRLIDVAKFVDYEILPRYEPPPWSSDDILRSVYRSPYDDARPRKEDCFITCAGIDCSGVTSSPNAKGSYSAIVVVLFDVRTNDIFIRDVARIRNVTFERLREFMLLKLAYYNPAITAIEDAMLGSRLGGDLNRSCPYPILMSPLPHDSKEERIITTLLPYLDAGKLHIPKVAAWRNEFLSELADAPFGRYNDQSDAACLAVNYCRTAVARKRGDELFDQQLKQIESGWMQR